MLINGSASATISALDRGLHYGDGLFETLAVVAGEPCLWQRHMTRLELGCRRLGIEFPDANRLLEEVYLEIGERSHGVVKIILTRGSGGRGYRPAQKHKAPTRLVNFSAWPAYPEEGSITGVQVRFCTTRLGCNPLLAGLKTLNRLEQVMARAEWDDPEIAEGLLLDSEGRVVEGTMSNLFLLHGDRLTTTDLIRCGVAGVMRELVLEQADQLGFFPVIEDLLPHHLQTADALFLTNSLIGIWPVRKLGEWLYDAHRVPPRLIAAVKQRGFQIG